MSCWASTGLVAIGGLILFAAPASSAPKQIADGPPPAQVTALQIMKPLRRQKS